VYGLFYLNAKRIDGRMGRMMGRDARGGVSAGRLHHARSCADATLRSFVRKNRSKWQGGALLNEKLAQ
jgi:hypothetical protein